MKIGDQIAESILIHRQISKEEAYKEALEIKSYKGLFIFCFVI